MPGEFSAANAMAAGVTTLMLGLDMQQVCDGLSSCPGIPGRTEVLHTDTDFTVIRDYAHTPDGLEKVLPALKPFVKNRLMVLFGCPGAVSYTHLDVYKRQPSAQRPYQPGYRPSFVHYHGGG